MLGICVILVRFRHNGDVQHDRLWKNFITTKNYYTIRDRLTKPISKKRMEVFDDNLYKAGFHEKLYLKINKQFLMFLITRFDSNNATKFSLPGYGILSEGQLAFIVFERIAKINFDEIYDKKEGAIAKIIAQKSKYASPLFFSFGSKFKTEKNIIEMQTLIAGLFCLTFD